jgi:hypothetical protein
MHRADLTGAQETSMKRLTSSLLVSTGLLVLGFSLTINNATEAIGRPVNSERAQGGVTVAADDLVVLERRFAASNRPCVSSVPTDRVFPDGSRALFVVPLGKAFVLTDIEGETRRVEGLNWLQGDVAFLRVTITGAVAPQSVKARTQLSPEAAAMGFTTLKLHLESGVVADSGAALCLSAYVVTSSASGELVKGAFAGNDVQLHGYLINR